MMNNPEFDIKSVAVCVGYFDQHYFRRIFKAMTGLSPTEFRGTVTWGQQPL